MPALDGVRGIAILSVLLFHFAGPLTPAGHVETILKIVARSGWIGVDLFFVLSGYLITGILLDTRGSNHYFRNFYARRILRIFPLYYGYLAALLVASIFAEISGLASRTGAHVPNLWLWTYLSNYAVAGGGWNAVTGSTVHFWSLAIEEQFYLCWPLVVARLERRNLARVAALLLVGAALARVVLTIAGASRLLLYVSTPTRLDGFCLGALLATGVRDPAWRARIGRWGPVTGIGALTCVGTLAAFRGGLRFDDAIIQLAGYSSIALLAATLVANALGQPLSRLRSFLTTAPLKELGKYSYGIYVFHVPVRSLLVRLMPLSGPSFPAPVYHAFFLIVGLGCSCAAGWLSWYLYESRFLALKARFLYGQAEVRVQPNV